LRRWLVPLMLASDWWQLATYGLWPEYSNSSKAYESELPNFTMAKQFRIDNNIDKLISILFYFFGLDLLLFYPIQWLRCRQLIPIQANPTHVLISTLHSAWATFVSPLPITILQLSLFSFWTLIPKIHPVIVPGLKCLPSNPPCGFFKLALVQLFLLSKIPSHVVKQCKMQ